MHALNNFFSTAGVIGFAAVWYFGDIYYATGFLMLVMTAQLIVVSALTRSLHKISLMMWLLVVCLGTLTLVLRDKAFIQLKTSFVYGGFAVALLLADWFERNLPQLALAQFFDAPAAVWRRVSQALAGFFILLSLCNYWVASYFSEAVWVGVKTFAFPTATFIFMLVLIMYLYRYVKEESSQ